MTRRPPPHVASTVLSAAATATVGAVDPKTYTLGPEMRMPVYAQRSPEWHALSPLEQHVLAALWSYARSTGCPSCAPGSTTCSSCFGMAGWTAWCTQDRLAALTGSPRGSIQRALRRLATAPAAGEASHHWLDRRARWSPQGERWATGYTLLLPGAAGLAHAHALEVARGAAPEACTCADAACESCSARALFWPGDVFVSENRTYIRTTRVSQRVIASVEFAALRVLSPSTWRALLVLSAHTGNGEQRAQHLRREELGAWIGCCLRTTYTVADVLEKQGWGSMRQRVRPGCKLFPAWSLRLHRADLQAHTSAAPAATPRVVPMTTSTRTDTPPDELLDELRHQVPGMPLDEYSGQELWGLIEGLGIAEISPDEASPPPTVEELAVRVVRAFHGAWRPLALEHYTGLPRELEAARALLAAHGPERTFQALAYAVEHLRKSWRRGPPGEGFGAVALAMMREGLQLQSA